MNTDCCPELKLFEGFYDAIESDRLYQRLFEEQDWPDNHYSVAGRQLTLPRLQTWHADTGIVYSYSDNLLQTRDWSPLLSSIKTQIESYLNYRFNSVLVNLYRSGEDYVGWHSDNEPELGEQPYIASLTLGAARRFALRHKKTSEINDLVLANGDLLVMEPNFQHHWQHSVPLDNSVTGGRINLTFRNVIPAKNNIQRNKRRQD
ncbi:2OG-Fe(II) oxygenase [Methyloprofundus sedimenti]|uniref:2OG-Fe(II) oxygenase n=1 Tax=Methyloprofundus sedimenti TaxID=1420851 RepID=A0A1V8MAT5_9GAMM|nr:alpha-ketoglutarate-dependent dioxygenase AlkB [Methyloprofundus sedimenti]OQK18612.1 2OG-Fe(II) oxygenase [Methyloprofundus sedimenti]